MKTHIGYSANIIFGTNEQIAGLLDDPNLTPAEAKLMAAKLRRKKDVFIKSAEEKVQGLRDKYNIEREIPQDISEGTSQPSREEIDAIFSGILETGEIGDSVAEQLIKLEAAGALSETQAQALKALENNVDPREIKAILERKSEENGGN